MSVRTIHYWVEKGQILQPTYFGNRAFWSPEQIKQILAEGTQPPGTYPPKFTSRIERMAANRTPVANAPPPKRPTQPRNEPTRKPKPKTRPPARDLRPGGNGKGRGT